MLKLHGGTGTGKSHLAVAIALRLPAWRRRISTDDLIARHRRNHFVDPRSVAADRFEFCTQLGLAHAARSDDLQILLLAVEVRGDFEPDAIRIKKIEGMNRRGNHQERTRIYRDLIGFQSLQYLMIPPRSAGE